MFDACVHFKGNIDNVEVNNWEQVVKWFGDQPIGPLKVVDYSDHSIGKK